MEDQVDLKLEKKIYNSIGKRRRKHMSDVKETPNSPNLLLKRPNQKGFFSFNQVTPASGEERFEVFLECKSNGIMCYTDIKTKFGIS